jgi:hypothetical protein
MHINLSLAPIVALVAGILIVVGLLGLFGTGGSFHFR